MERPAFRQRHSPTWLARAKALEASAASGTSWVYNLYDPGRKDAQVGMANDLYQRLSSRWRATSKGGFLSDGIPWLSDRLAENPSYEPVLDAHAFSDREFALEAERNLRVQLRAAGWHVSSDV